MKHEDLLISNQQYDLIIKLLTKNSDDLESLRASNHEIRNGLHRVSNTNEMIKKEQEHAKHDTAERFERLNDRINSETKAIALDTKERLERVHTRIDSELETMKSLEKELNGIAPQVKEMSQSFMWAKRIVITALMGGVIWATVEQFVSKTV